MFNDISSTRPAYTISPTEQYHSILNSSQQSRGQANPSSCIFSPSNSPNHSSTVDYQPLQIARKLNASQPRPSRPPPPVPLGHSRTLHDAIHSTSQMNFKSSHHSKPNSVRLTLKPDRPQLPVEILKRGAVSNSHLQQTRLPRSKQRRNTDAGCDTTSSSLAIPVLAVKPVMKYWPNFSSNQPGECTHNKSAQHSPTLSSEHIRGSLRSTGHNQAFPRSTEQNEKSPHKHINKKVSSLHRKYIESPHRCPIHQTHGAERNWTEAVEKKILYQ